MEEEDSVTARQVQFTRYFAACEQAMSAFAYSLLPNRADADDLIQDTLVALWEHFDDYDPDRPFLPWANQFVYRQVQMYRRSQGTRAKYFFSDETIERFAEEAPVLSITRTPDGHLELSMEMIPGILDVATVIEGSSRLDEWTNADALFVREASVLANGNILRT